MVPNSRWLCFAAFSHPPAMNNCNGHGCNSGFGYGTVGSCHLTFINTPLAPWIILFIYWGTKPISCCSDPAWYLNWAEIKRLNGQLTMVLLTHCHFDHLNALKKCWTSWCAGLCINKSQTEPINALTQTQLLGEGDTISFGAVRLTF